METTEEFTEELRRLAKTSVFVARLLQEPVQMRPYALRYVSRVVRERERFSVADWVVVRSGSLQVIARIRAMAECLIGSEANSVKSVVRFFCDSMVEPFVGDDGELWAEHPSDAAASTTLVHLESVYITVKTCNSHQSHLTFI